MRNNLGPGFDEGIHVSRVIGMDVSDNGKLHGRLRDRFDLIHQLGVVGFAKILGVDNDKTVARHANCGVSSISCDHEQPCLAGHWFDCGSAAAGSATASLPAAGSATSTTAGARSTAA